MLFDVDGTLYDGVGLRRRMMARLLVHVLRDPRNLAELRALRLFRSERERLAEEEASGVGRLQYERPAAILGWDPDRLRRTVETWMHQRPLPLLRDCRFPGVERLFAELRGAGRRLGVVSDYPAAAKLEALGLVADVAVAAVDPVVDRLKPHPAGLAHAIQLLGVPAGACLFIGDRDERDGACSRRLGVDYLLKARRTGEHTFADYRELLGRSA